MAMLVKRRVSSGTASFFVSNIMALLTAPISGVVLMGAVRRALKIRHST